MQTSVVAGCVDSVVVAHGLISCTLACGGLPRLGIKSASSALQGRFLTTGPPGKPVLWSIEQCSLCCTVGPCRLSIKNFFF